MVNRALPTHWTISNGESAEKIAGEWGLSREEQDAFAVRSHRLAAEAWAAGVYDGEVVQVPGAELASLADGGTPAADAPDTYAYQPYPFLVTVEAGVVVGLHQVWVEVPASAQP